MPRQSVWVKSALSVVVLAILVALVSFVEAERATPRLVALDVGQGDALYLRTPAGQDMLIDTGPNGRVVQQLERVMPRGDRTLEYLVLTHLDADHIGGAAAVLDTFSVQTLATNGDEPHSDTGRDLFALALEKGLTPDPLTQGERFEGDGFVIDVLWPLPPEAKGASAFPSGNEHSVILRLQTASTSILFTGDVSDKVEQALIARQTNLDVDVLKVGHHGSKTSTSEAFLKATTPDKAVISVGAKNRYGHPTQEVLDRLQEAAVSVFRTDEQGPVSIPL
jgi:competence protein ComEC